MSYKLITIEEKNHKGEHTVRYEEQERKGKQKEMLEWKDQTRDDRMRGRDDRRGGEKIERGGRDEIRKGGETK